jgi:hypothetical protein
MSAQTNEASQYLTAETPSFTFRSPRKPVAILRVAGRIAQKPSSAKRVIHAHLRTQEHGNSLRDLNNRHNRSGIMLSLGLIASFSLTGATAQDNHQVLDPDGCWRMSIDGANSNDAFDPTRATNSTMAIKRALAMIYRSQNGTEKGFVIQRYGGITTTGRELDERLSTTRAVGDGVRLADIISFCVNPGTYSVSIGSMIEPVDRKLTLSDEPVHPVQISPNDKFGKR